MSRMVSLPTITVRTISGSLQQLAKLKLKINEIGVHLANIPRGERGPAALVTSRERGLLGAEAFGSPPSDDLGPRSGRGESLHGSRESRE